MSKSICIVTGASGLIGSECMRYFADKFDIISGIDNDGRKEFFGKDASTINTFIDLEDTITNSDMSSIDISNRDDVDGHFKWFSEDGDIQLIIHTAAQPSHDWATYNPHRDFEVNALGTLNLLEAYRKYCPKATFIFTSTNKVYGDRPNLIPLEELGSRYEYDSEWIPGEPNYVNGIDEKMSIDQSTHSLFGCSKAAADLYVQEYGRYFNLNTGVFRGGCLTGPGHQGAEQHGFLSYLVKCIKYDKPYTIYGYNGLQVRDIIHSYDVATIFDHFRKAPRPGEVYNIGGGRFSNCSVKEAIVIIEKKLKKKAIVSYSDEARKGDHIWYVTDMTKFKSHYPTWNYKYTLDEIIDQIIKSV
jgi:CDP-paratose 2-epimerase